MFTNQRASKPNLTVKVKQVRTVLGPLGVASRYRTGHMSVSRVCTVNWGKGCVFPRPGRGGEFTQPFPQYRGINVRARLVLRNCNLRFKVSGTV